MTKGILLVNLGTPDSPKEEDVKRFLKEFLTDGRVIDLPYLKRHFLVRCIIVPKRYRTSAKNYQSIWSEEGSPILRHGKRVESLLQERLGDGYRVRLAMRYQNPSIEEGLEALRGVDNLTVFPLFPQYASATTGSVHQKVFEVLSKWRVIPSLRLISHYEKHPALIDAFAAVASKYALDSYDHILFSYHGLPEKLVKKEESSAPYCYPAQCLATTRSIAKKLKIPEERWSHCYQSRLGKDPWIKPYTTSLLDRLVDEGRKRVLLLSPSFVCDCLETLEEIQCTYKNRFIERGGEALDLVQGLNDHPKWIDAIETIIKNED
ncbi:MAG: Ferrochelatase [Chlamydiae bacterium]|nr:Ferrochelatase [Chlamydiota bacterium]